MITRVSNQAAAAPEPVFATASGVLQRKCDCGNHTMSGNCDDCAKKKSSLQRKATNEGASSEVPGIVHEVLRSSGQPLDASTRAFFEPRFGYDFSNVRVHTDENATESARRVNALAYTVGPDIVLGDRGAFNPSEQRKTLAHELTHVVQQKAGHTVLQGRLMVGEANTSFEREADQMADWVLRTPVSSQPSFLTTDLHQGNLSATPVGLIQRKDALWDKVKQTRELKPDKIPKSFNYELVNHRLIAHTFSTSDIDAVIKFVSVLGLSFKIVIDESDLKAKLTEARKDAPEAEMRDFDVTPFLPESLQRYLTELEKYYDAERKYIEKKGFTPDDIFDKFGKLIAKASTKEEKAELEAKQVDEVKAWYAGEPHMPTEYHAACHQFVTLETAGSVTGVIPGSYVGPTYEEPLKADLDAIVASLQSSLKGKGPYRPVDAKDVQIGDIAVFLTGKTIKGEDSPEIAKGGAIHSAMVIRIKGTEVELLEKTNPWEPMATRTVGEVLSYYSSNKAYVKYLAPTLKGMPATSPSDIGSAPPSRTFTTLRTKAPEDTHVLFKQNTAVTLPHEDRKLFSLIARVKTKAELNIHGYASEEGDPVYNLNLSAHRAVAVADALQPQVPADSKIEIFAHGETEEFGSHEEARRAGVELKSTSAAPATQSAVKSEEPE